MSKNIQVMTRLLYLPSYKSCYISSNNEITREYWTRTYFFLYQSNKYYKLKEPRQYSELCHTTTSYHAEQQQQTINLHIVFLNCREKSIIFWYFDSQTDISAPQCSSNRLGIATRIQNWPGLDEIEGFFVAHNY